jgi:hypothetical protein
MGIGSLLNA